jgi:ketosteroid isomerase-like protein
MNFKLIFSLVIISLLGTVSAAQTSSEKKTIDAIRAVIEAQRDAWNKGDVACYMDGYDRSDKTVFVSGDTVTHGWQTVLERYKKSYDTREKMGQLTFSDLEFNILSKDTVVVVGRWLLKRTSDEPHGRFTLIFKKTKAGWRIILDCTTSA